MKETMDKEIRDRGLKVLESDSGLRLETSLNSCVRCGLCAESCLYYLATGEDRMIPARKVDLVASVYRRYRTFTGRMLPAFSRTRELDADTAKEMVDVLFGGCTLCGRCTLHCSVGVDIVNVIRTGRRMLSEMGMVPATLQATALTALETGNNMGIHREEFLDTLKWMEEELADELNDPSARIPVDEPGKRVLYTLNPREPKFFPLSISAMAKIFYAAGESWTLSTAMYDVTNYAYFTGDREGERVIGERLRNEVRKLDCKELILAECGHGSLAFRWEAPNNLGESFPFGVRTSVELIAAYLREGKIKLNPGQVSEPVTLHDPCNLVRNGGVIREQREILQHFVSDFREMAPHGTGNFCCGGGGGQLAMSEYNDRRMRTAEIKAEQIRKTGARIVVSPCHNCVDQLTQINVHFKLGVRIKTLAEIVADALVIEPAAASTHPEPIQKP